MIARRDAVVVGEHDEHVRRGMVDEQFDTTGERVVLPSSEKPRQRFRAAARCADVVVSVELEPELQLAAAERRHVRRRDLRERDERAHGAGELHELEHADDPAVERGELVAAA